MERRRRDQAWRVAPLLLALIVGACSAVGSDLAEAPELEPARENPDMPGIFSGAGGAFVIERRIGD